MSEQKEYVKLWLSYRSYFEEYSAAEVGRLVLAMMDYRASGATPEFSGSERFIWPAIRRDIDESIKAQESISMKRSEAGKLGGRPKAKKANAFSESKKSYGQGQGKGQGQGQGKGQEIYPDDADAREDDPELAELMTAYTDAFGSLLSASALSELLEYYQLMGKTVPLHALDKAKDNGVLKWTYIRGILRNYQAQGCTTLADAMRVDEQFRSARKGRKGSAASIVNNPQDLADDVDYLNRLFDSMGDGGEQ